MKPDYKSPNPDNLKSGNFCYYEEDGQEIVTKVVKNNSNRKYIGYKLQVIKQNNPHPFCSDAIPGETFDFCIAREYKTGFAGAAMIYKIKKEDNSHN